MILGYSTLIKNLTGERKAVFSTPDITSQLNVDNNACLITSGNIDIISSDVVVGTHASLKDLHVYNLSGVNASFLYTEFDEYFAHKYNR